MRTFTRIGLGALSVLAGVLTPAAAMADAGPTGAEFGQHVQDCARTMGLSGTHNPGMHQGRAGWDGMTCHEH
ncbi:MAG TPA: hypothetical protein VF163_13355 [Micromonosporaceae bacterium]